jgi:hypothetical protein
VEDLALMGSRCHICLLEYPSSGSIHRPLRSSSHGPEHCCFVKGGDGGRPGPHGEPLSHLSAGVPLLRQHIHTPLRSSSHEPEVCCWCEGRRWWKTWPTWGAAATSVGWSTPPQAAYTHISPSLLYCFGSGMFFPDPGS